MQRALALAARGLASTDPNPRVGCVIARGERIIGEGWHERAGEAHAEVAALRAAGPQAAGATAYVTLEPCSHHGRTPPCTQALGAARIARVVYALDDPNPQVNGSGAAALRAAGIAVESGLLAAEAAELNPGFLMRMRAGRPFVRLKLAMSLDGRTALPSGASRWITGAEARADVHAWRARSSAILTGVGTALADDPRLTVRAADEDAAPRQPLRVVLDGQLRTPARARLLGAPGEVLLLSALGALDEARAAALSERGARIELLPAQGTRLDLAAVLARLAELEVNELLVEAGPTLAGALLAAQLVDELLLYVAPALLGDAARPLVSLPAPPTLDAAPRLRLIDTRALGPDLRLRLRPGS
ncbi:MAG: bifunctional diaminohydroxyphosphoribosylaminopyrimidine deaminase/5-amino-6-(5-phosphoribosylamino)uracil reductase RibD [Gammaproteobacteria bacterium]|nr:bifunctional diaminohydroxyphosphoribosylaminopyrimidine deaminase/5-amino-6-(5-phosphoribosylamino)uracil reductase RibD [Gammaproteobacteria bacterium]MBV9696292.1 bifunctional diaminohydroxyphosphoribosylaminopyrimidine deaminase/5-amino-6-(5-phosphoribosylamino)uracil reductase RibD [Gammaproteobacteria bacterium]